MGRPQADINAEIELHRPEREARILRMQLTFAVCEEVAKRMMEGADLTSSGVIAAVAMREAAAKRASDFLDTSWTREFPEARLTVSLIVDEIRALPLPEWTPDPREPKGCPTPGACSCPSLTDQLTAERDRLANDLATTNSQLRTYFTEDDRETERVLTDATDRAEKAEAERDRNRTFVRSARGIVQHFASANPKHIWGGHEQDPHGYSVDPFGAHAWLSAEELEIGTARDGGDPKVEKRT